MKYNLLRYIIIKNVLMNIYKLLNLCLAIKTISSHAFFIKIATVVFSPVNYFHTYNKATVLFLQNKETQTLKLKCGIITATK